MQVLSEILGYEADLSFFERLVSSGKLPASVLLTGPPMVGKTTILEEIGKKILCDNCNACGACLSCKSSFRSHPDVIYQEPDTSSFAKDSIQYLLSRVHEKPLLSQKMVIVLERIDEYSWQTVPLLLKALEDAPPYVHFLLTASQLQSVLPTVRSRSLVRHISPLSNGQIENLLIEKMQTSSEKAQKIAKLSGGRLGLVKRLLADDVLLNKYKDWYDKLTNLSRMKIGERAKFAEELDKAGEVEETLNLLQSMIRERVRAVSGNPTGLKNLLGVMRRSRESKAMLKSNVPPRLALEYTFFIASPL